MKNYVALSFALMIGSCLAAAPGKKPFEAALKTCQEKLGASKADVELLMDYENMPQTDESKKLLACTMEEDKSIVNGKFVAEGAYAVAKGILSGKPDMEEKLKKAKDIADKCETEVNAKPAASTEELATQIRMCLSTHSKEAKLDFH